MDETKYFDQGGVLVTNSRFVVGAKSYPMAGVTSVRESLVPPRRLAEVIFGVLTLLALLVQAWVPATLFGIVTVFCLVLRKPQHRVSLCSPDGDAPALSSADGAFAAAVVDALNRALLART